LPAPEIQSTTRSKPRTFAIEAFSANPNTEQSERSQAAYAKPFFAKHRSS
jgi:hypothetical protein